MVPVYYELRDGRTVHDGLQFLLTVLDCIFRLFAFRDVTNRFDSPRDIPVTVIQQPGCHPDHSGHALHQAFRLGREGFPVPLDVLIFLFKIFIHPERQIDERRTANAVERQGIFMIALAEHFLRADSGHPFHGFVPCCYHTAAIDGEGCVRQKLDDVGQAQFRFLQGSFRLSAVRDVSQGFNRSHHMSVQIIQGPGGCPKGAGLSVLHRNIDLDQQQLAFPSDKRVFTLNLLIRFKHQVDQNGSANPVKRHGILAIPFAHHLLRTDTGHLLHRTVPCRDFAFAVNRAYRIRKKFNNLSQPLLGFLQGFYRMLALGDVTD